jgi:hypothetical protein
MDNQYLTGNFNLSEIPIERDINNSVWIVIDPYDPISECGMQPKDLKIGHTIIDQQGIIMKIVEFGSGAFFGKGSFSYTSIRLKLINHKI